MIKQTLSVQANLQYIPWIRYVSFMWQLFDSLNVSDGTSKDIGQIDRHWTNENHRPRVAGILFTR